MKKKFIVLCMAFSMVMGSGSFALAAENSLPCMSAGDSGKFFEKIIEMIYGGWNDGPQEEERPEQEDQEQEGQENAGYARYASEIISLTNKERSSAGLAALKEDPALSYLARMKAEDMAQKGYFSHTSPTYGSAFDMMKDAGISYSYAGENIAKGQASPQSAMNGWMNSSGHRENILGSSFTHIGTGVAADKQGTLYWVQIFKG